MESKERVDIGKENDKDILYASILRSSRRKTIWLFCAVVCLVAVILIEVFN